MKIPKKEKITQTITLASMEYSIDIDNYLCHKAEKYFSDKITAEFKVKRSRGYKKALRDIKAVCRVLNRLKRHGWEEKETQSKEE